MRSSSSSSSSSKCLSSFRVIRWFDTDVSGLPIGPVFEGLYLGLLDPRRWVSGSPETSVSNHLTPCNNPDDGPHFNLDGSLKSHTARAAVVVVVAAAVVVQTWLPKCYATWRRIYCKALTCLIQIYARWVSAIFTRMFLNQEHGVRD